MSRSRSFSQRDLGTTRKSLLREKIDATNQLYVSPRASWSHYYKSPAKAIMSETLDDAGHGRLLRAL
jgi:hypothetical protein